MGPFSGGSVGFFLVQTIPLFLLSVKSGFLVWDEVPVGEGTAVSTLSGFGCAGWVVGTDGDASAYGGRASAVSCGGDLTGGRVMAT